MTIAIEPTAYRMKFERRPIRSLSQALTHPPASEPMMMTAR
jgi:hypothetical protein